MPWKFRITAFVIAPLMILSFQNCSDFSLQDQIMYEQALLESRESLDAELIPKLTTSSELRRWYKTSNNNYVNLSTVGDQWSVVLAVPRTSTGTLYSVRTGVGDQEGSITISAGKIQAVRSNSVGTTYSETVEAALPASGDNMVIAASFGAKAGEVSLLVNGKVQQTAAVVSGTPEAFTSATKILNSSGTFGEYMIYVGDSSSSETAGKLGIAELNVMSRYIADNLSIPNVIFDPVVVGGASGGGTAEDAKLAAVKTIISNKCMTCHGGTYSPNLSNFTAASMVSLGQITAGNALSSKLYLRLQGSGGSTIGNGKDMPQGGSISASEVQAVADWINSL
ncbi:hypothetical protein AZI86_18825 [Bdellovibrio bacteriovorus]|uniref:Cytochrome c domain-containing protein n=1 Tax=Bdellovibrio bacteriovorus TaxID=959 RepID=A0A150WDG9_BDEBC|nr:cytochrome c [Bdellovibrio bacteriovorus]KYG60969.1 hypothetical protein AZI86_18825 [Bdellovibrio bacteriovorus]